MSPPMLAAVLLVFVVCGGPREAAAEQCRESDDTVAIEVDLTMLKGKWYEFASFGMLPVVGPRICHSASFYPSGDGSSLAIVNDFVIYIPQALKAMLKLALVSSILLGIGVLGPPLGTYKPAPDPERTSKPQQVQMECNKGGPDDKTKLTVTMSLQMIEWVQAMFRVIATDYNSFIIISICQFIEETFNFKAVMILTKRKIADDDLRAKIREVVKDRGISFGKFVETRQENCDDVAFPDWVADVGRRDPRLPRDPLPSRASGKAKLYDYIPLPPFDKVSKRLPS